MKKLLFIIFLLLLQMLNAQEDTMQTNKIPLDQSAIQNQIPLRANDTLTFSFKDTDIRDVFRAISYKYDLNIFVENSITKRVTVSLNKVIVYDALQFLCEQNGLILSLEAGIFKISNPPIVVVKKEEPKKPYVLFEKGNLYLEIKNVDLELLILAIQDKTNKNILITSGTNGTVTGKLIDIDFDLGFMQLMNNNGFAVQKKNNIYVVSKMDYFVGSQSGQQTQKTGPYWISVKDSLVNIDITNAPIDRAISDIARQLNNDIIFYNAVSGSVTVRASNVTLFAALDLILRNTNYTFKYADGIFFIGEKSNKTMVSTRLLKLKYLRCEKFLDLLPQSLTGQTTALKILKEQNAVVTIASQDVINQINEFILQVDKPVAQVLIEALVVDFDLSDGKEFGINAGVRSSSDTSKRSGDFYIPGLDLLLGNKTVNDGLNALGREVGVANLGKLPSNFYMNIKALEEKGLANVRSRPLLATLNGHQASLSVGTTQYYILKTTTPYRDQTQTILQESQQFQTIEANVKLELTPYVGANGQITLEIKPDFKTPIGDFNSTIPPTIAQRTMSSTVIISEGETIVLGGLIQDSESETRSQVPILGDIPWIGALFASTSKSNRKTELIIYLTTHISYGEAFQNVSLPAINGEK